MGGLDQVSWNVFEGSIDRQDGKRRVDMRESKDHRERAIQQEIQRMPGQVHILQQSVQYTIASQDGFPRVSPNQIADPQRNDYQLVQQILFSGAKRQKIRQRIAQQKRQGGYPGRN